MRVRGELDGETMDEVHELRLMNDDGSWRSPESFHDYFRVIILDLKRVYDIIDLDVQASLLENMGLDDGNPYYYDFVADRVFVEWPNRVHTCRHDVPWLFFYVLGDEATSSLLRDLELTRGRYENPRLRLVLSKIPQLAGHEHIFRDFYSWTGEGPLLARRSDVVDFMSSLVEAFRDFNVHEVLEGINEFHAKMESGPPGIQARGTMTSQVDGVRWAVARENEFAQWLSEDDPPRLHDDYGFGGY